MGAAAPAAAMLIGAAVGAAAGFASAAASAGIQGATGQQALAAGWQGAGWGAVSGALGGAGGAAAGGIQNAVGSFAMSMAISATNSGIVTVAQVSVDTKGDLNNANWDDIWKSYATNFAISTAVSAASAAVQAGIAGGASAAGGKSSRRGSGPDAQFSGERYSAGRPGGPPSSAPVASRGLVASNDPNFLPNPQDPLDTLVDAMNVHVMQSIEAGVDPMFVTNEVEGRLWDSANSGLKLKMGEAFVRANYSGKPENVLLGESWLNNNEIAKELGMAESSNDLVSVLRTSGDHSGKQIRYGKFHLTNDNNTPGIHWDAYDVTSPAGLLNHSIHDWLLPKLGDSN